MGMPAITMISSSRWSGGECGEPLEKGLKLPHQQEIHQQIEIVANGCTIHTQGAAKGGSIQQTPLVVGQHGPEAAQSLGRNAWSQLGDVALQIGANELFTPDAAAGVIGGLHAVGEAAANPEAFAGLGAELQH